MVLPHLVKCLFLIKVYHKLFNENKVETQNNPSFSPYHKYKFIVIQNMHSISNINSSTVVPFNSQYTGR